MQNKANLARPKMNTRPIKTKDYEKRWAFRVEQKQSQTKPIKANFQGRVKWTPASLQKKGCNGKGNTLHP
jgi:hypothetical protein